MFPGLSGEQHAKQAKESAEKLVLLFGCLCQPRLQYSSPCLWTWVSGHPPTEAAAWTFAPSPVPNPSLSISSYIQVTLASFSYFTKKKKNLILLS